MAKRVFAFLTIRASVQRIWQLIEGCFKNSIFVI